MGLKAKHLILIPNNVAATTTLTVVEDKIPNVSNVVKKKNDYNAKISEIEKKRCWS